MTGTPPAPGPTGEAAAPLTAADVLRAAERRWQDAGLAAALFAVHPDGFGALRVRARLSPARARFEEHLRALWPEGMPFREVPANTDDRALLGGLDLLATISEGEPVRTTGLLRRDDEGVLVLRSADRLSPEPAAILARAATKGVDGRRRPLVVLDEGEGEDGPPPALAAACGLTIPLDGLPCAALRPWPITPRDILSARARLQKVSIADDAVRSLSAAALSVGVPSLRVLGALAAAARAAAAMAAREAVEEEDCILASRLVLGPYTPAEASGAEADPTPADEAAEDATRDPADSQAQDRTPDREPQDDETPAPQSDTPPEETLVAAAAAAALSLEASGIAPLPRRSRGTTAGKRSKVRREGRGGKPRGARPGSPREGGIDVVSTLLAAAPWQTLRGRTGADARIRIWPQDIRIRRTETPLGSSVIFVVDASGSAAFHRLAEVKGAIERLLGECYSRRDTVSVVAFRGSTAERLVPPTPSVVRVRRAMAALPGGGGTPLPAAIDAATRLALDEAAQGRAPLCVFLSDGRGNVTMAGVGDRAAATAETAEMARRHRATQIPTLLFDTSPRPRGDTEALAASLGARYAPLPPGGSAGIARTVAAARVEAGRPGRANMPPSAVQQNERGS